MKSKSFHIISLLIVLTACISLMAFAPMSSIRGGKLKSSETTTISIFNGRNLKNWVFKLKDQSVDPKKVFMVKKGVIQITGTPFGYMRTKNSYSDYLLHIEWRWPGEPGNSGVFIHTQVPDTVPVKLIEVQLAAGHAGDFMCSKDVFMKELTDTSKRTLRKLAPSSEKPAGEWNVMEVTCKGNTIEVIVNGVLQNRATGVSLDRGHICLQSEGKLIEFRNLLITKLK
jgi:hypothetical protein